MASGDISKRLTSEIRDMLSVYGTNVALRNNYLIYNSLSKYQSKWVRRYRTTMKSKTITLTGEKTYPLDDNIYEIISVRAEADNTSDDYTGRYDEHNNTIIIDSNQNIGDKITIDYYINILDSDRITNSKDPIIQEEYYDLLIEAVISDFNPKMARPLMEIENDVRKTANELKGRFYASNQTNLFNRFNL